MANFQLFRDINVVAYNVTDWARAKKFYTETLGLGAPFFVGDEFGWCEWGVEDRTHVAINRSDEPLTHGGGATIVFSVDDAHATVAELRKRGVKCDDPIGIPNMVTYATFYDPDGNRLQIAGPPPTK